jgi:uncharacterized membrane protein
LKTPIRSLGKKTIAYFFQGLMGLLPVFITIYALILLVRLARGFIGTALFFLPSTLRGNSGMIIFVELIAVVTFFFLITVLGFGIRTMAGKFIMKQTDKVLNKIPALNVIYRTTRQIIDIFSARKENRTMKPVMVEWPSEGRMAIGFVTGGFAFEGKKLKTVFIPTTPNPTSGYLIMLPPEKVQNLDIPFETAVKMILTGGMIHS